MSARNRFFILLGIIFVIAAFYYISVIVATLYPIDFFASGHKLATFLFIPDNRRRAYIALRTAPPVSVRAYMWRDVRAL